MKLSYKIVSKVALMAVCALATGVVTACHDDDNNDDIIINEPPTGPDLSVSDADYWVKVGESVTVPVTSGGGDYSAFALNPEFVEVSVSDNNVIVKAVANGSTDVIVTDANDKALRFNVVAYTTRKIEFEASTFMANVLMGHSGNFETKVTNGNGGYSLVSTTIPGEDNVYVNYETGEIAFSAVSRLQPVEYSIVVKDVIGLEGELKVKVSPTFDPFPAEYVAELKGFSYNYIRFSVTDITETEPYWYPGYSSEEGYSSWCVNATDITRQDYDDGEIFISEGQYVCGWWMAGRYEDFGGLFMDSDSEFTTDADVAANLLFKYSNNVWWPFKYRTGGKGRIIYDGDDKTVFGWSRRDDASQHYDRAVWVHVK